MAHFTSRLSLLCASLQDGVHSGTTNTTKYLDLRMANSGIHGICI